MTDYSFKLWVLWPHDLPGNTVSRPIRVGVQVTVTDYSKYVFEFRTPLFLDQKTEPQ